MAFVLHLHKTWKAEEQLPGSDYSMQYRWSPLLIGRRALIAFVEYGRKSLTSHPEPHTACRRRHSPQESLRETL